MIKPETILLGICLFLIAACSKHDDGKGAYRKSADGKLEVLYLQDGLALFYFPEMRSGVIAISHGIDFPDYKSQTPDQIEKVLVEHVKSIYSDYPYGVISGEIYIHEGKNRYFLLHGETVYFFAELKDLYDARLNLGYSGRFELYTCRKFIDLSLIKQQQP